MRALTLVLALVGVSLCWDDVRPRTRRTLSRTAVKSDNVLEIHSDDVLLEDDGQELVALGKGFQPVPLPPQPRQEIPNVAPAHAGVNCIATMQVRGMNLRQLLMFAAGSDLDMGFRDCIKVAESQMQGALETDDDDEVLLSDEDEDDEEETPEAFGRRMISSLERWRPILPQIIGCSNAALQRLQGAFPKNPKFRACLVDNPILAQNLPMPAFLETNDSESAADNLDAESDDSRDDDSEEGSEEDSEDSGEDNNEEDAASADLLLSSLMQVASASRAGKCMTETEVQQALGQAMEDAKAARRCLRMGPGNLNLKVAQLPDIPRRIVLPHIPDPPRDIKRVNLNDYATAEEIEAALKNEVDATAKAEFRRFVSFYLNNYDGRNIHAGLRGLPYKALRGLPKKADFTGGLNDFAEDVFSPEPGMQSPKPRRGNGYGAGILPLVGQPLEEANDLTAKQRETPSRSYTP